MSKRKTKAQREAEQLAALTQRLTDIYSGAVGTEWAHGEQFSDAETLSRVVPVCRDIWLCEEDGHRNEILFGPRNLDSYDDPQTAAEFLFRHGCRA